MAGFVSLFIGRKKRAMTHFGFGYEESEPFHVHMTLPSSLGGRATAGDGLASLAVVSDINPQKNGPVLAAVLESGCRKDEWMAELHLIPASQEVAGGERFGLQLEDWDSLLSESGQDQSLLRWISSEVDDGSFSLKHLLQSTNPIESTERETERESREREMSVSGK